MAGSAGRKHGGGLLTVQDQNWERDGAMQCRTKPEKGDDWQCMAVRDQNREGGWLAVQDQNRKRGGWFKVQDQNWEGDCWRDRTKPERGWQCMAEHDQIIEEDGWQCRAKFKKGRLQCRTKTDNKEIEFSYIPNYFVRLAVLNLPFTVTDFKKWFLYGKIKM